MFFNEYREFVEFDPRKKRPHVTVTVESLSNRCAAVVPKSFVEGKTILDMGSALGAMGHYALIHGAKHYTGVEIQDNYLNRSKELLSKYHTNFQLVKTLETNEKYDIVLACGYIFAHFNLFSILEKLCELSNDYVVIESHNPNFGKDPCIRFTTGIMIRNDGHDEDYNNYDGIECIPNKQAVDVIMANYGYECVERIYPAPTIGSHDAWNDSFRGQSRRFIAKYKKTNIKLNTLEVDICNGNLTNQ
jgi:hypothetical protein